MDLPPRNLQSGLRTDINKRTLPQFKKKSGMLEEKGERRGRERREGRKERRKGRRKPVKIHITVQKRKRNRRTLIR